MDTEILIVKNSKAEQKAIRNVLSSVNFRFNYASNGTEAILMAKRLKPTLIISQVEDSHMDGITMADIMRKDKNLKNTPIIFIHSDLNLSLIAAAKQVGSKAFLVKPYINNTLIYAVKKVLEVSLPAEASISMSPFQTSSYVYA